MVINRLTKMAHFIHCTKTIICKGTTKLFFDHVSQYHGFLKDIIFLLWTLICLQVLYDFFWNIKCEDEIIIKIIG
jgi:hypothetical protein